MAAREIAAMQETAVGADELTRAKACLVRQLALSEAGIAEIAQGILGRTDLGLPLDEPTRAAERYVALDGPAVQDAFRRWLRPQDLVRVSEVPPPESEPPQRAGGLAISLHTLKSREPRG